MSEPVPFKRCGVKLHRNGVGRDKDCDSALQFYFNRRVTDGEMRFLDEVIGRVVACMPEES